MERDSEGFLYPRIDSKKCINCGKCEKACPINNRPTNNNAIQQEVYAAWSKDKNIRQDASSGGMFETLARSCLENKGIVFGAAFDEELQLKHTYATNIAELKPLCKSKYLQSDMNGCYEKIKAFLDSGKEVLFVGTPCQVAAMRNYIGEDCSKLTLVDLICHGVPSQDLFDRCMRYEEKRCGIKIEKYSFRTKIEKGAIFHYYTEGYFKNGVYKEKIGAYYQSPFYLGFQKRLTLRPSCYKCCFSNLDRASDITIADFHGIEKYIQNIDIMQGVSMVIVNTLKGKELFNVVKKHIEISEFNLQVAIENNECLTKTTKMPIERYKFVEDLETKDFHYVVKNHLTSNKSWALRLYHSLPSKMRLIIKKVIRGIKS